MLEEAQRSTKKNSDSGSVQPRKMEIDIDALEIWGVTTGGSGEDEIENQKKRLAWEEAEAARRRGVNFGGDRDGARHLLEMAGIVGQIARVVTILLLGRLQVLGANGRGPCWVGRPRICRGCGAG